MKLLAKIWSLGLLALLLSSCAPSKILAQGGDYISEQEFYDELQPYGTWVYDPQFGNVWVPDVEEDFRPYATRGHWALTEYGNTWVSEYPWGWATFHYGRWRFDDYYGWQWIPGSEWAPAWVSWRGGDDYYGWAPLGPDVNMEASYADDYDYNIPQDYFVWVPQAYITYTNVYNYYVPRYRVRDFYNRTTYIRHRYNNNNRYYFTGPRRDEIQRVVRRPVRVYNIHDVNRPSDTRVNNNNTVNIYRPAVRRAADARPSRVVDGAAYRRENPGQRIGGTDRSRGVIYNPANANKLADAARSHNPDSRVVRVNRPQNTGVVNPPANRPQTRPAANEQVRPSTPVRGNRPAVTGDNRAQEQQTREQQRQAVEQQRQQARDQQRQQQDQQQQQQVREQQRQQAREQQRQQQEQQQQQVREEQRQAVEQQRQQAREQQRQQQEQQQQQVREQQRQAVEQQRQQAREQQRQQQEQQQQQVREQQRQAVEQQRQQAREQQRQQQEQQQQQVREQQRQAVEQQRQQAREQQRQQQDQMREQQRQQAEQQRQQAREQQRQQAEQQRQSQPQPQQHRPRGGK